MTRSERNQEKAAAEEARRRGETISVGKFTGIATPLQQGYERQAAEITARNQEARSAAKDAKAQRAIFENKRNVSRAQAYIERQPSGPQQGSYYTSKGEYTGERGGGVQSSRLQGSIKPAGVEELERQAQQARNAGKGQRYQDLKSKIAQTYQDTRQQERARILAKSTAQGQFSAGGLSTRDTRGAPQRDIPFQTREGRTQSLPYAKSEYVTSLSPGFAGKASAAGINVVRDDRVLLQDGPLGLRSTGTQVGTKLGLNETLKRVNPKQNDKQYQARPKDYLTNDFAVAGNVSSDVIYGPQQKYASPSKATENTISNVPDSLSLHKTSPNEYGGEYIKPVERTSFLKKIQTDFVKFEDKLSKSPRAYFLYGGVKGVLKGSLGVLGNIAWEKYKQSEREKAGNPYEFGKGDINIDTSAQGELILPILATGVEGGVDDLVVGVGKKTSNVVKDIDVIASGVNVKSGVGLPGTRTPTKITTESVAIVKSEEQNSYFFGLFKGKPKKTTGAYIMDTKAVGGFDEAKGAVKTKTTIQRGTPDYNSLVDDATGQRSLPASFVGKGKPVKVSQGRYGFLKDDQGNVLIAGAEKTRVVNLDYSPQPRKNLDRSLARTTQRDYKIQAVATSEGDNTKIVGETFKESETLGVSQNRPYFSQKDIKAIRNPPTGKIDSVDVTLSKTIGVVDEGPARRVVRYNAKTGQFVDTPNFVGGERKVIGQVGIKKKLNADIPTTDTRDLSINKILRERPKKQIDYLKAPETQKPKVLSPELPDTPNIISVQKQAKQSQQAENILGGARGQNVEKRVLKDYLGGPRTQPIRKTIPVKLLGRAAGTIGKASIASGLASKLFGKQKSNLLGGQKPKQNTDLGFDTGQEGKQLIDPIQQRTPDTSQTQKPKQDQFLKLTTISIPGITTIPGPGTPPPPNKPIVDVPGVPFNFNRSGGRGRRYGFNRNPFAGTRKYKTATPQQFLNKLTGKKLLKKNKRKGVF